MQSLGAPSLTTRDVCQQLLQHCATFVRDNQGTVTSEHPILGWFTGHTPREVLDAMPHVLEQLRGMWSSHVVASFFSPLFSETDRLLGNAPSSESKGKDKPQKKGRARSLVRFFRGSSTTSFVSSTSAMHVQAACAFFSALHDSMPPVRLEVVGSLAFGGELVPRLWTFMAHVGPKGGMQVFVDALPQIEREPLVGLLVLAVDLTHHLLTVLSDHEVFEAETPFSPSQLLEISKFLHVFVFRSIWEAEGSDTPPATSSASADANKQRVHKERTRLLHGTSRLLRHIRELDARHAFVPDNHWAIKGVGHHVIVKELARSGGDVTARSSQVLLRLPHMIPFLERVKIFQSQAKEDRARVLQRLGEVRHRPYTTVRRTAVLTDGFQKIPRLGVDEMKEAIRIQFVNELGLSEAGIDQEGLFKVSTLCCTHVLSLLCCFLPFFCSFGFHEPGLYVLCVISSIHIQHVIPSCRSFSS